MECQTSSQLWRHFVLSFSCFSSHRIVSGLRFHPGRVEEGDKFFLCLLLGLLAESADVEHHRLILADGSFHPLEHLPIVDVDSEAYLEIGGQRNQEDD